MRLRELDYPIALLYKNGLIGGEYNGLGSPKRWNANIAEFWMKGGFPGLSIFSSDGWEYQLSTVWLRDIPFRRKLMRRLVFEPVEGLVDIDGELERILHRDIEGLSEHLMSVTLSRPHWWQNHSTEREIQTMFDGCGSHKEIINSIGVLEGPQTKAPENPKLKIIDRREPT